MPDSDRTAPRLRDRSSDPGRPLEDPSGTGTPLEAHVAESIRSGLAQRGHPLETVEAGSAFGHAHAIEVSDHGSLSGAADPRALAGGAGGF